MNKGISPLIAGVLMIAFTLAVAAIVSGFFTTITKTGTTQISTGFASQVNCTKASLDIIETACLVVAGGNVNVSVAIANTGPIALTSPQFYFKTNSQKICVATSTDTLNPGTSAVYRFGCNATGTGLFSSSDVLSYVRVSANCLTEKAISIEKSSIGDVCS